MPIRFGICVNDHRLKSVACATNFRPGVGSPANAVLPTVRSAMDRSTSEFHPLPARSGKRPDSGRGIKGVSAPSLRRHGSPSLVHMPVGSRPSTVAPLRECLTSFKVFGGGRTLRRAYSFPSEGNTLGGMPVPSLRETKRCRRSSPHLVGGSPRREGLMMGIQRRSLSRTVDFAPNARTLETPREAFQRKLPPESLLGLHLRAIERIPGAA